MQKRERKGLSTIIVTLILILVSIVAVGIVWLAVRNIIQTGTEGVGLSQFSLSAKILDVAIDNSSNNISLTLKRNAGKGELTGISFVFSSRENNEVITRNVSLKELEQMKFYFHLDNTSVSDLISVSIVPLIKQDEKEIPGIALDKYNLGKNQNNIPSEQTSCTPVSNPCGTFVCGNVANGTCGQVSCGTCGTGYNCVGGSCVVVTGNFRYVRAGATGTNNGSDWTNAYTSLPAVLLRNYTYYIADGDYAGYSFDDVESGTQYITIKKAILSNHGTDTGWQSSYGDGQAIFTSSLVYTIRFLTGYYEFDGQIGSEKSGYGFIVNNSRIGLSVNLISVIDVQNIILKHIETYHHIEQDNPEVYINLIYGPSTSLSKIIVSNCYLHDASWNTAFYMTRWNDSIIENSYIENIWKKEAIAGRYSHNITIRGNTWKNVGAGNLGSGSGSSTAIFALENVSDWKIYNNLFIVTNSSFANFQGSIGIWSGWAYYASNIQIYGNTFVNLSMASDMDFGSGNNNLVYNNLFYNCQGIGFISAIHNYNWFYPSISHGETNGQNGIGNPFVNFANDNFKLNQATQSGLTLSSLYNLDMDGNIRGVDGVWDRGAYEYV